jgi:hypothetical protein
MPRIPYAPEAFPPQAGPLFSKGRTEDFSWAELVHAAITVGRRNWSDVLQHGSYSVLEILWRIAMLRANLRGAPGPRRRLIASSAYRGLDQSEKGAVSFFIGLCMAKAFATRLLNVPWLLHLSTYRAFLNPLFVTTDRPDFVGFDGTGRTVVIEAKGRTGNAPNDLMAKAKQQTQAISTISGVAPTMRIAMASCFSTEGLRVRMADPTEPRPDAVEIAEPLSELARAYYRPLIDVARTLTPAEVARPQPNVVLPGMDVTFELSDEIVDWYVTGDVTWTAIMERRVAESLTLRRFEEAVRVKEVTPEATKRGTFPKRISDDRRGDVYTGPDGVTVRLGPSWSEDFMAREPEERGAS